MTKNDSIKREQNNTSFNSAERENYRAKRKVFNLLILDESGSMCSIEYATVSGLNETIQSIKHAQEKHPEQEHLVSLMTFNSERRKYHYDSIPASDIQLFDGNDYEPDSGTPLYDAIGSGISKLRRQVTDDDQVLVTIITDGLENDSHEYDYKAVTSLMDKMNSRGWMVTYIGANQDAIKTAHELHIDNGLEYDATPEGVTAMMGMERESRGKFYDCVSECASPMAVKEMINGGYFDKKKKKNSKK
jgi:Mg-chelatase subunit ChlD